MSRVVRELLYLYVPKRKANDEFRLNSVKTFLLNLVKDDETRKKEKISEIEPSSKLNHFPLWTKPKHCHPYHYSQSNPKLYSAVFDCAHVLLVSCALHFVHSFRNTNLKQMLK